METIDEVFVFICSELAIWLSSAEIKEPLD